MLKMKDIFYFIFGIFFSLFKLFPTDEKSVVLLCLHNEGENGSMKQIENALKNYGEFNIVKISRAEMLGSKKGAFVPKGSILEGV